MPYELSDFHFLLLHFPIALFIAALIFDLLSYVTNNNTYETVGYSNMLLGIIFSIPTTIAGFITDMDVSHMSSLWPFYSTHGVVQLTAALFFILLFIIHTNSSQQAGLFTAPAINSRLPAVLSWLVRS